MSGWLFNNLADAWLKRLAVPFEYSEHVKLADFVKGWEKTNRGRPGPPIMEDYALSIAEAMAQGVAMPSVILHQTPLGVQPLDGLQRCYGTHLNGGTFVAAHIVKPTSTKTIYLICDCANYQLNGKRPPEEFQLQQALRLIDEQEMSVKEVALSIGLRVERLQQEIDRRHVVAVMADHGMECGGQINGALDALRPLVDDSPKIAAEILKVHVGAGLSAVQTRDLVGKVMKHTGTHERLRVVQHFRSLPDISMRMNNSGSRRLSPTAKFFNQLRGLINLLKNEGDEIYLGTEAERTEVERMQNFIGGRIRVLLKNHMGT